MATKGNSHVHRNWKGLTRFLKSAACECLLIVLLFVDAAFSYFLTRFAQYYELQVPCVLCSRLDHVFGNEKPGYYWNLFCSSHRSEVSSLISCNIHGKLVDGRGMCENCLSSHIEENKSNSDTQRVSSGKLGIDPAGFGNCDSQSSFLSRDLSPGSKCARLCLCCNKPWIPRDMDESKKESLVHSAPETPSKRLYSNWATSKQLDANDPHDFRCLQPDVLSENDVCDHKEQLADQKTSPSVSPENISLDDIPASSCLVEVPSYSSLVPSDLISLVDKPPSVNVTENPLEASSGKLADVTESSKNESISIEKNEKIDASSVHVSPVCVEEKGASVTEEPMPAYDNGVNKDQSFPVQNSSGEGIPLSFNNLSAELQGNTDDFDETTNESNPYGVQSFHNYFTERNEFGSPEVNKDQSFPVKSSSGEGIPLSFNNLSAELRGNTDDFDETANESNPYGVQSFHNYFTERNEFDSPEVNKDQSLPVKNSFGEGIHLRGQSDDFETTDESYPYKVQSFDNLFVTERSDFGSLQSLDGNTFNEIEGEDLVDRLKRLVEYYRKCMAELYKELEEERNASTIATNQSMAMITRLQEEKSALQMETMHYLRLMEEQAEYDGDALDKANDLLAEKEKEIQDQSFPVKSSSGKGIPLSFNNLSAELRGNTDDFDETANESNPYGVQSFHNYFTERNEFDSPEVNKDQSLPVKNSFGEGIHLRGQSDDFETTDESYPYKVQSFDNLFVTERSDFGSLQSLDGNTFNEIEGEDLVDRLKRLVEYYRKCMAELYKELEEERNASTIATNQAMAMITRLQEEKSALQMETVHYLRLMEEQAEYDGDALDKANDLLAEKEKEIQDLEAEIEFYRLNFTDETQMEALAEASIKLSNGHVSVENMSTSFVKDELNFPSKTVFPETCDQNANPVAKSAWSEFEDEKLYISERLRNLESKVSRFAHHGPSPHISGGKYFDEAANGGHRQQEFLDEKDKQATREVEGNDLPVQKASSVSNGSAPQESFSTSISKDQVVSKGNSHMVSNEQKGFEDCNKTGLSGLENEISDLNERLDALVADCKFLEHSLKSLQNGNEGLLFVQEILHELRELRKLGIRCRNMSVS